MKKRILFTSVCLFTIFIFQLVNRKDQIYHKIPGSYKALDLFSYIRAYPYSDIPSDGYSNAFEQHQKLNNESLFNNKSASNKWSAKGPLNTAGRTLSIAVNPLDPQTVYLGSASGGLWRSRSLGAGQSWEYMPTGFPVLGVSTIAFPEKDSSTMYIGTGEVYNFYSTGTDGAYRSTRGSYGIGILKSKDGGRTWEKSLDWSYQQNHGIWMIKVSKLNANVVYAVTTQGVYKSIDAGNNWNQILDIIMATDLEIDPRDDNKVIVACGNFGTPGRGIYRTSDGGGSWLMTPNPSWFGFQGKILLARAESNPDVLYASVGNGFGFNDGATWLLRTEDNGRNWNTVNQTDYSKWQGWFSHDISVHPQDENELVAVGIDIYKSTNGGANLDIKTSGGVVLGRPNIDEPDGGSGYSHSDHHFVLHHPDLENLVLFGNDGGMFISYDRGETVQSANGGLQTTQFYNGFSISQSDTTMAMGGLQDNSTVIFKGDGAWQRSIGGDGSWSAINQRNDDMIFGSYQGLNILKSVNDGQSFFNINLNFQTGENPLFISPYVMSDSENPVMYAGGIYIYKSEDLGESWNATNNIQPLNGDPAFCMDVHDANPDIVYVGTVGGIDIPRVFSSTDGGQSWNMSSDGLPNRIPNDIAIDPFDPSIAYVCFSGFGSDHLFKTEDFGLSWEPIGLNLPDAPCNAIAIDPLDPSIVYLGNDISVYVSTDGGLNFEVFGSELPDAFIAMDLVVSKNDRQIWLATHGNGAYKTRLQSSTVSTEDQISGINNVQLFPNPAVDILNIRISDYQASARWNIYSLSGAEVMKGTTLTVDVSNLESGIYFIVLVDGIQKISKQFIVQN